MGKVYQQRDRKGGKVYPVTLSGAVITPDGRTIQKALEDEASQTQEKVTELELKVDELEKRPVVDKDLTERVADLENTHKYDHDLAKARIKELSVDEPIKVCNAPAVLIGAGAPSASVIPQNWDKATMGEWFGIPNFIGQMYVNISASSNALYVAVNDTATNGWKTA